MRPHLGDTYVLDQHDKHYLRASADKDMILVSLLNPPLKDTERHSLVRGCRFGLLTSGTLPQFALQKDCGSSKGTDRARVTRITPSAIDGEDIALVSAGRLKRVLVDWCPPFPGYHLYYPSRRQLTPAYQCADRGVEIPESAVTGASQHPLGSNFSTELMASITRRTCLCFRTAKSKKMRWINAAV